MTAFDALTLDAKLGAIWTELTHLRDAVDALVAIKHAKDDTAETMNAASRSLMDRNARRNRGEACPECQDVQLVYDALGAIPCPNCIGPALVSMTGCIQADSVDRSDSAERDRP